MVWFYATQGSREIEPAETEQLDHATRSQSKLDGTLWEAKAEITCCSKYLYMIKTSSY